MAFSHPLSDLTYSIFAFILIITTIAIGIISLIAVIQLSKRIIPDPTTSFMTGSILNKSALSVAMILIGMTMFAIGVALYVPPIPNYSLTALNFTAIMVRIIDQTDLVICFHRQF